ncbi:MAG TPA: hypothetical protein VN666_07650 [Nitrospira sp.]|nr:hypothetical protein [Nitrospira sp.]
MTRVRIPQEVRRIHVKRGTCDDNDVLKDHVLPGIATDIAKLVGI